MKILITGIKGFTGRYVAAACEAGGHEVFGLGLQPRAPGEPNYFQADLGDGEAIFRCLRAVRPQVIIHLAAVAFVAEADQEVFYRVNLLGARNLVVAAARAECTECLVLASSANVYGNQAVDCLTESCTPQPANEYAVAKLAMEHMARTWQDRVPLVITRPFNYTGLGQSERFLIPKIVAHFKRRETRIRLGNLDVQRDFCDVRAVADAYRAIAEVQPIGATLNICSGRLTPLGDIVKLCESITAHCMSVEVDAALVRSNEVRALRGDPGVLAATLGGWAPPSITETLRWMLGAATNEGRTRL